ncbi:Alpha/Beta hydrolase protein [Fusarium redolens]|uniref:Carboxypeptidase n=1 Tax=Fusarium redolens TaxID=48865 RepID=A0A9P9KKI9_FUSRE|nr:Alpha/Beta hydrolase protein [Fusarium redolens]KAH7265138.1 Alpha/Beta hydrolase protein [Fusarium redolens]
MAVHGLFSSPLYIRFFVVSTLVSLSFSQFIPSSDAKARNLTVVRSPANRDVTVSYKTPEGVCSTAFDSQKQYTGWVSVPGDYPTNLFFWFVEARERTDSLTIWLNGGPGSSSLYGFFTGNGPCEVVEKGLNEYETLVREWGWDRASNILFIDQPNQVGFSYDTPTDGTVNFASDNITEPPVSSGYPEWLVRNGTFSSNNGNFTANTTETAAMAVWHMVQGFLTTFPQYQPASRSRNSSLGINLFAESYGGRYGPIFAETFVQQNARRESGELPRNSTIDVHLSSLGIVNGCVDMETQVPYYPIFASDNTYGYKALSASDSKYNLDKFSAEGGCRDLLQKCATDAAVSDPEGEGDEQSINEICSGALTTCNEIQNAYSSSGRGYYDLAAPLADPFPPMTFLEYLNQDSVQQAIGSPINFTLNNRNVGLEFQYTGDQARGGNIARLASLLNSGVRIALIYGDRDYICNWLGGEAVSQSLAKEAGGEYSIRFPDAGYAPIIVNDSYIGGVVRQFGNLSFSRVYQAGHAVPAYQPETAFQVFARIILGTSISTGMDIDAATYNTTGDANATHTEDLPKQLNPTCYVRNFQGSCDSDAEKLIEEDKGIVVNGILYTSMEDWPLQAETTEAPTTSTSDPSSTSDMTGVYTATETPDAAAAWNPPNSGLVVAIAGILVLQVVA